MKSLHFVSTVLLVSLLSACGGGGGGSPAPAAAPAPVPVTPAAPPVVALTVNGVAGVGTWRGATVTAYAIESAAKGRVLATATTSADGSYRLDSGTYTGPVLLEVSGGTYRDQSTGKRIAAQHTMRTLLTAIAAGVPAHVTVLTEALVRHAEAMSGGLTAANIASAHEAARLQFGFNPVAIAPLASFVLEGKVGDNVRRPTETEAKGILHWVYAGVFAEHMNSAAKPAANAALDTFALWLRSPAGQAPAAIVSAADTFGWNPRNYTNITNWESMRLASRYMATPPTVEIAPKFTDVRRSNGKFTFVISNNAAGLSKNDIDEMIDTLVMTYPKFVTYFRTGAKVKDDFFGTDLVPMEVRMNIEENIEPDAVGIVRGGVIHMSAKHMRAGYVSSDTVAHEAFHVTQYYWIGGTEIKESLAEYARYRFGASGLRSFFPMYLPGPNDTQDSSYAVGARFLRWIEVRYRIPFAQRIDADLYAGTLKDSFYKDQTGKDAAALWAEYVKDPAIVPVDTE